MRNLIKLTLIIAVLTFLFIKVYVPLMSEDQPNVNRTNNETPGQVNKPSKEGYILAEACKKISFITCKHSACELINKQWIQL